MGQDPVTAAHKSLYGAMGLPRVNGGGPPAEIWAQYTKAALKGKPVTDFDLELQPGAEIQAPSSQAPVDPTTGGEDDGGTTGDTTGGEETPGQTEGQTQGQDNGGTTTTGGDTTTGGTTGDTTTGGGTTDGGTTTAGPRGAPRTAAPRPTAARRVTRPGEPPETPRAAGRRRRARAW